jgi:flagellar biosynthesis/type III secretory pathway protein FliH
MQPPPGRAAEALAVPSAGDELAGEVSFLFADLDEIENQRETLLAAARSDAGRAEQAAVRERNRLVTEAHEEGERRAAIVLDGGRARAQRRTRAMLAEADRDAAQIHARARKRVPALVAEIAQSLLEDAP